MVDASDEKWEEGGQNSKSTSSGSMLILLLPEIEVFDKF